MLHRWVENHRPFDNGPSDRKTQILEIDGDRWNMTISDEFGFQKISIHFQQHHMTWVFQMQMDYGNPKARVKILRFYFSGTQ